MIFIIKNVLINRIDSIYQANKPLPGKLADEIGKRIGVDVATDYNLNKDADDINDDHSEDFGKVSCSSNYVSAS